VRFPTGAGAPLVADRRRRHRRGGDLRQFAECEGQLRLVELFTLAAAEELFLQPVDLRPQHRILLFKELDPGDKLSDICHSTC